MTTFVSRTALMGGTAAFPASAPDHQIDFPEGELIDPLRLRLAPEGGKGRRGVRHELSQVIFHAHNDGLRLPAPVDHEPLLILLDTSQDLAELGSGGQGGHDFGHSFGTRNDKSLLPSLNRTNQLVHPKYSTRQAIVNAAS